MEDRQIHMTADTTPLMSARILMERSNGSGGEVSYGGFEHEELDIVKRAREAWKSASFDEIAKRP